MDPNESSGLSSYFQHQQLPPPLSAAPAASAANVLNASPTNGVVPNTNTHAPIPNPAATASATSSPMAYSNTVPPAVSGGMESVKRKRGRPRKYSTPEEAAAAKRLVSASNPASPPKKRGQGFSGGMAGGSATGSSSSARSFQLAAQGGTTGDKFKPHVINVAAGEDVGQKIMFFMQQNKAEICIISASGSIANASLRQPATSGGSVTYEGRFEILSLSGSYVRTEHGGRTGGLSVCLAGHDGQIIGGGVGGPLMAAGPIQVIVGTFVIDNKKDVASGDTSGGKSPSPIGGTSVSGMSFRSQNDSYQNFGGGQFMNMQ